MLQIANHTCYALSLPLGHRFPMEKYQCIPEQLLYEGVITSAQIVEPGICSLKSILAVHDVNYVEKINQQTLSAQEQRAIGFPQSKELAIRESIIMQGTIDCAIYAVKNNSIGMNIAGGTHHAFANKGEGFCLLNDLAIAAQYLLMQQLASKILIIDLDVHQGNGTASIFSGSKNVFTFSMHGAHNYPFKKEKSHLDVGIEDGTNTEIYLALLQKNLQFILENFMPNFVFYQSGVDILETDKFGKLQVSLQGCKQRDEYVIKTIRDLKIPMAIAMGGGYSPQLRTIVEAHCNTFRVAAHYC
jgi:acetoin utilization deacetylase AcuC-like enzyme